MMCGRLLTATDNSHATAYSATYAYVANSPLIAQISYKAGSTPRMTTTNQFDYLNRLTQKSSLPCGAGAVTFNYSYNSANQRTYVTNADGSFWAWGAPLGRVAVWKGVRYLGVQLFKTLDFTIAGYKDRSPSLPRLSDTCATGNNNQAVPAPLEWRWMPYHPN